MPDIKVTGTAKPSSFLDSQIATGGFDAAAYEKDVVEKPVEGDTLKALQGLAQELLQRLADVDRCAEALRVATEALAAVQERRLPDLMEQYGIPEFSFLDRATGETRKIKFDARWRVTMPPLKDKEGNEYPENEAKRTAIFAWLREIGQAGSLKKEMIVPLQLLKDDAAMAILAEFQDAHPDLDPGLKENIHQKTLEAIVRRLKKAGKNIHADVLVKAIRRAAVQ